MSYDSDDCRWSSCRSRLYRVLNLLGIPKLLPCRERSGTVFGMFLELDAQSSLEQAVYLRPAPT